jgi:hypothetical protein
MMTPMSDPGGFMRTPVLAAALVALVPPSTAAFADPPPWAPAHGKRAKDAARVLTLNDRVWRGDGGRYHCRRSDGTTGLIVGAAAGALLGRALDSGRSRTLGTIVGAAGGALLGREIAGGKLRCE